jgi:Holliday junction resolvase-like predicted endonuclease
VAAPLGARVTVRLDWRGEEFDRLLDAEHAQLVETVVQLLRATGWETVAEAGFSVYGERGSVDVLAFCADASVLLVVEVKTVVPDMGSMLIALDRKRRLAATIGAERGWRAATIGRVLVLPDSPTARRRVAAFGATFAAEFPARTVDVRRWIARPREPISGLWFLSSALPVRAQRRVVRSGARSTHERQVTSSQMRTP